MRWSRGGEADEAVFRAGLERDLGPYEPRGLRRGEVGRVAAALAPAADLPAAYRAFLRLAGRSCGSLWIGSDVWLPGLLELRGWAEELLVEDGGRHRLDPGDVVFLLHGGYDAWFLHGAGPDPEVWCYLEGDATSPRRLHTSFTGFVAAEVRRHAEDAVHSFVRGWHGLRHWCLERTGTASTLDLVRAVEAGRLPPVAAYLERGDRYEVGPGARVTLVSSPIFGPEGERHTVTVDPTTGEESFTAADVHAGTASYAQGRYTVPLVHLEAAVLRLAGTDRFVVPAERPGRS